KQIHAARCLAHQAQHERPFTENGCAVVGKRDGLNAKLRVAARLSYGGVAPAHSHESVAKTVFAKSLFEVERGQVARQRVAQEGAGASLLPGAILCRLASFLPAHAHPAINPYPSNRIGKRFNIRFVERRSPQRLFAQYKRARYCDVICARRRDDAKRCAGGRRAERLCEEINYALGFFVQTRDDCAPACRSFEISGGG